MTEPVSHLQLLATLLKPAASRLAHALCVPDAGLPGLVSHADVSRHLDDWRAAIRRLENSLPGLTRAISNERANAEKISKAGRRLVEALDGLLALYAQARGIVPKCPAAPLRLPLCAAHEHTLNEINTWLLTTIEFMDDPRAALERRGLPTTGKVTVDHTLTLTPSASLDRLAELMEQGRSSVYLARKPEGGLWPILVALAVGWWAGKAMSDDD